MRAGARGLRGGREVPVLFRNLVVCVVLSGCDPAFTAADPNAVGGRVLEDGTPEADGVLGLLNDPGTTRDLLDDEVALDARAARNLILHRDGPDGVFGTSDDDRFDSVTEVDGVPQVGEVALGRLLAWADANGWIDVGDDAPYGVVEGVELTRQDAVDILRVANGATLDELDLAAGLDARAAEGIRSNRPFGLVEDVSVVPYVGQVAIQRLLAWGRDNPVVLIDAEMAVPVLEIASSGLWHTSESDYPLEIWILPPTEVTVENATVALADAYSARVGEPGIAERTAEEVDLDRFFDRYTEEWDYWEPSQVEAAVQWRALRAVFDTQLAEPRVIRLGVRSGDVLSGAIDVFVFGITREGALAGFRTVSVET